MGCFAEGEALPVDPGVEVIARSVNQQLEAHLWILCEVHLSIHQGFHKAMISSSVDIAEDEVHASQLSLCPKEGQQMGAILILIAFPLGNVVVGKAGILIGTIEDKGMKTSLDANVVEGLVGDTGLYPETWEGIARNEVTVVLIVFEERQGVGIKGKSLCVVGREMVVAGSQPCSQFLSMKAQGTGRKDEDDD